MVVNGLPPVLWIGTACHEDSKTRERRLDTHFCRHMHSPENRSDVSISSVMGSRSTLLLSSYIATQFSIDLIQLFNSYF